MSDNPLNILLVEDNPDDALLIEAALAESENGRFKLQHVIRLSEGLEVLSQGGIDVVLLDLFLPDSHGPETFTKAHSAEYQAQALIDLAFEVRSRIDLGQIAEIVLHTSHPVPGLRVDDLVQPTHSPTPGWQTMRRAIRPTICTTPTRSPRAVSSTISQRALSTSARRSKAAR